MSRTTGNRRSKEDLEKYKSEARASKFTLVEQTDFRGSDELLEKMKDYERSYREGRPVITDEEWDRLVKETGYVESLDQVVAPSGRRWMKMSSPLVSLRKVCDFDGIKSVFDRGGEFIVAPKLDGLTFDAFYVINESGSLDLHSIGTRGDGLNSLIVHDGALDHVIKEWLPESIDKETTDLLSERGCVINGRFELRGEALIDKYEYAEENHIPLDNLVPRTVVSGIFNRKVSYSLSSILTRLHEEQGYVLQSYEEIEDHIYEGLWDGTSKETKSLLSKFGIVSRSTDIDSIVVVGVQDPVEFYEIPELKVYVRERAGGVIRGFDMDRDKGKARFERLYFVSFSVSSEDGNIDDPDLIRSIPGVKYIGDVEDFEDVYTVTDSIEEAVACIDNLYGTEWTQRDFNKERLKLTCRFALDGVVIKPVGSNSETQKVRPVVKNGKVVVPNKPADQVAVKLETDPVRTRILKINKKTTSLGNVTVTAEIEPTVVEGGATVSNVNLHNEGWLSLPENSWIKEGAECELRMSMDIIPILSPIKSK